MARRLSADVLAHLRQWEGCVLYAYDDRDGIRPRRFIKPGDPVRGKLTIGYGHTETVVPGMRITQEDADRLFEQDCAPRIAALEQMIRPSLTDNQFGALLSWLFNVGEAAARSSTLIRKLNAGDFNAIPGELARWNKDDGVVVDGLVNRRAAEAGLWAKGEFVASTAVQPAPPATAPSPSADAGWIGAVGVAAPAAASVVSSFSAVPWPVALVIAGAAVALAALWLLKRQRAA